MKRACACLAAMLLLLPAAAAQGRGRHDPLNPNEIDELRENAINAPKRVKLLTGYAKARMEAIEQLRSTPVLPERGKKMRVLLDDFEQVVSELESNLDNYEDWDLRKVLPEVIQAAGDWQLKLRAIREGAVQDKKLAEEMREYSFVLDNTIETVNSCASTARDLLEQQNQAAKNKKKLRKPE